VRPKRGLEAIAKSRSDASWTDQSPVAAGQAVTPQQTDAENYTLVNYFKINRHNFKYRHIFSVH
jgi:hypothetical protein